MSAETWDSELAGLASQLGQQGAINPAQAEMLRRLVAEIGARAAKRPQRPEVVVRTAVPLTPEERSQLEGLLARRFGPRRPATFEVDPQVLGGVWLRVGDRIVDGSLRGRLETLRKQMGTGQ